MIILCRILPTGWVNVLWFLIVKNVGECGDIDEDYDPSISTKDKKFQIEKFHSMSEYS